MNHSQPSDTSSSSSRLKQTWSRIQFWIKLIIAFIVLILVILGSVRQLFAPINGGQGPDPIQKMLEILENIDGELRHAPSFLPLRSEWNGTQD